MATRRCQSARFAFFFILSFYACFFSLVSPCALGTSSTIEDKVLPRDSERNYFGSLSSSLYRFEQTYVNTFARGQLVGQLVHQKCLSATVYLPKLRCHDGRRLPFENRRGQDRVSRSSLRIP